MEENKNDIIIIVLFALFFFAGIAGTPVWAILVPLFLLISRYFTKKGVCIDCSLSVADYCVLALCICELASCLFSVYPPNSFTSSLPILLIAFYWLFFRRFSLSGNGIRYIFVGLSVLVGILSIITLVTFAYFQKEFGNYEMGVLTDYKKNFTPMGFPINDWITFTLCLLPYPLISAIYSDKIGKTIMFVIISALSVSALKPLHAAEDIVLYHAQ